ncbi:MAG: rod shape-determining protein MreC [bacterium]|nr:rod shape-determining protein MreC [bacterium]
MVSFLRRHLNTVILLILILLILLLIFWQPKFRQLAFFDHAYRTLESAIAPLNKLVTNSVQTIQQEFDYLSRMKQLHRELNYAKKEKAILHQQISWYTSDRQALTRLRKLLELREKLPYQTVSAEVIATSPSNYYFTITIDKGSSQGLKRNMVVLSTDGVIGRVLQVAAQSSKVLLISDQRSAVGAVIDRTRARGIIDGIGKGAGKLTLEQTDTDVKIGDTLVTSGLGGVFPKDLVLGTISKIERHPRSGWITAILVTPAASVFRTEEVLVIVHPTFEEIK